jgi:hypothetical protein
LREIAAHNANKDAGEFQEGRTAMLSFGDLIEQFDPEKQPRLGAVDVYKIQWRGVGFDSCHLRLFPVLQQKEGLRDGVSTAPRAFDQQVKRPHMPQGMFFAKTYCDRRSNGGRQVSTWCYV